MDLLNYKIVLWDFDGVLMDTEKIREKGFFEAVANFPKDAQKKLLKYHKLNGGISRYEKFEYFFNEIYPCENKNIEIKRALNIYSKVMDRDLFNEELLINQTWNIVIERNKQKLKNYIVSASDSKELNSLLHKLQLNKYFIDILGSPTDKSTNIRNLLSNIDDKKNICLVGDSINDLTASYYNEIEFIGYNNIELKKIIKKYLD